MSIDINRSRRSYTKTQTLWHAVLCLPFMKNPMLNRNVALLLRADIRMHKRKRIMETESRLFSYKRLYMWLTLSAYQVYFYFYVDFAHYISSCMGPEIFVGTGGRYNGDGNFNLNHQKISWMTTSLFQIYSRYIYVLEDKIYLNCLTHSASHMLLLQEKPECICDSAWHLLLAL